MRTVATVGDWVSEFSLRLYEKQTSNGRFLPPMSSKIIALPHQFKGQVLFEKNSSCGALLIADEVGVGKTYSVGHILRSAIVSDMAKRILILCPARLVKSKWLPTMKQFGLSPVDCYSGISLQKWLKGDLPRQVMISSYEKASGPGVNLEQFEADFSNGDYDEIDMVIIDEIHNFVQDAKNRIGLARIALNLSASRIGLTATPIWNGSKDFSEIIDLLQPDAMLENDVNKALKIQGKLSKLCFELYSESDDFSSTELLEEVVSELGIEKEEVNLSTIENRVKFAQRMIGLSPFSSWLTRTTAREVNSSRKRIIHNPILVDLNDELGRSFWNPESKEVEETPSEKNVYSEIRDLLRHSSHRLQLDSMPSSFSNHIDSIKSKLDLSEQELQSIEELSNFLKELPGGGSKCNQIVKLVESKLQEEECKGIVIFTHWLPTFNTLKTALKINESKLGFKLYSCNPKDHDEFSEAIICEFQSHEGDEVPVILLTDKFKEGIDLFRANYMIHVDVPKNPLMVEQRIGRIDRLGQLSDTIHIFYVLLNQSKEHEYLEILKQRLEEFVSDFGIANPILPDDIGWKGKISNETIDLIKGKDFDAMSNLWIEDKLMTKLCEEFEKEHTDSLRTEYSKLASELFQGLLGSKPEQKEKSLLFPLKKETWRNFREVFAEGDNRLLGEAGKKGILDRNVNPKTKQFRLLTDHYGMPTNSDIRRRCVQLLMENQPILTPVKIYVGNDAEQTAIVELAYSIDQVKFIDLFAVNLSGTTPTILPESKWKPRLANSKKDIPVTQIEQINLNKYTEECIDVGKRKAATMLDRIILRLKMKEKRLIDIMQKRGEMQPDIKSRLEISIMGIKKKIDEISIENFEFKILGILVGENK